MSELIAQLEKCKSIWLVFDAEDCPIEEADHCDRLTDEDRRRLIAALHALANPAPSQRQE